MNDRREIERRICEDRRAKVREGLATIRRNGERRKLLQNARVNHFCDRFYYAAQAKKSVDTL